MFIHLIFDLDDTLLDTSGLLIPIKDTPEFEKRIQEPLPLLPGASENLRYLSSKYQLHLLTQGRPHFQNQKITSLGISHFFKSITICDPTKGQNKFDYFSKFLQQYPALPTQVMSIGNRRSTDLGPAKAQGYWTCWFAYGEHQDEPIQSPSEKPDFIISHHFEMIKKCQL